MARRSEIGAVVVVAALLAGCSSGSNHGSSTPTVVASSSSSSSVPSTASTSTTTSVPAVNPTVDVASAKAAVLTLADLPSGWTAGPHAPNSDPALDANIAACLHVGLALTNSDLQPHADSQDFAGPAGRQVQSGIAVFRSVSLATRWIQLYSTPAARACLATTIGASAHATLQASEVSLPAIGDGQAGIRISNPGITADAVFARRGRAIVFLAVRTPDGVDEGALLSKMIERLAHRP